MRRTLIFGRNNLIEDAPISRLDLLVCRNTLMYFNAETQGRILRHFHFALRPTSLLMLGRSEMMIAHRDRFAPASSSTASPPGGPPLHPGVAADRAGGGRAWRPTRL